MKAVLLQGLAFSLLLSAQLDAQVRDSVWTIRAGPYAGQRVRIDQDVSANRKSRFLRFPNERDHTRYVGWNPSSLPARVAFRPGRAVSETDSAAFWAVLRRMESDLGLHLFEPATLDAGEDPEEVIVVDPRSATSSDGLTLATWSANGLLYDARILMRSPAQLREPRTVTHEMMHALGFGHTSAWRSVMNQGWGAPDHLTPEDVAHTQMALSSRTTSESFDMWERLALAGFTRPPDAIQLTR